MATIRRPGAGGILAPADKPQRILAVDYGQKRIGLAVSDAMGLTAQPVGTMARMNRQRDMSRLREECHARGITHIIVGHPVHMTGEASEMSDEAARFAARLGKATGIGVELVDERLTSWEAEQTVVGRRKKKPLDDVAAAVLLRDYLEKHRERARGDSMERD